MNTGRFMKTKFLINTTIVPYRYTGYAVYIFYLPTFYKYRLYKNFSDYMRGRFGVYNSRLFTDETEIKLTNNIEK